MRISDWSSDVCSSDLNPRSILYQAQRLAEHVAALPTLLGDGMPEEPQRLAAMLAARLAPMTGDMLGMADLADAERRLLDLSDAIGQRYFLQRDRKGVGQGKMGSVRVGLGGRRIITKKKINI